MSKRGIRIIPKAKDPITPFVKSVSPKKWHLKAAVAKDRESGASGEVTYYDPKRETFAILRDDAPTGVHYYTIWGPAEREVADEIRALGPTYSEDELFAWWDRAVESGDIDDKVDAVLFLGVGAPSTPGDAYIGRLRAALDDDNKDVRNAAVMGAAYADWPEAFRGDLERIRDSDPDDTARQRAQVVLDKWASGDDDADERLD